MNKKNKPFRGTYQFSTSGPTRQPSFVNFAVFAKEYAAGGRFVGKSRGMPRQISEKSRCYAAFSRETFDLRIFLW
ncbi:hypothetical protein H8711_04820 [Clostridiaceae bacterium NSJ-31]|uniref:Uncharacterized protein n=1 Tax=Ligaoa zhengdingensis TaxID=2763658 RepID=A0A926I3E1_9FIRM|nr:hypothetical protein [Ligaoa zhengdingensis]MBC8546259.1 hypothetical protein [Ligaoa zhengdingensis]